MMMMMMMMMMKIIIIIMSTTTTYLFPFFSSNTLLYIYVRGKTMSFKTHLRLDIMLYITGF
jgi:hypothetical protein